ncbi:MAG: ribokinase [Candidatus Levybacteria bacterium]|nr:ribokinase [Candidatus Levybacteria bacterium]
MRIFFIAPYLGKQKYQKEYSRIIEIIESTGAEVLSAEKSREYQEIFTPENLKKYGSRERIHYQFIRQGVINADGLVVEASFDDLRVGHEMTLALLYKKPVLCLSQILDYGKYIEHEYFTGLLYLAIKAALQSKRWSPKQIVVLGSVNIDLVTKVPQIPKVDDVVISEGLKLMPGGKATNTAIGISRLGEKVWMIGKTGNDFFGESLKDIFKREEIDFSFVDTDSFIPTGTVMVNVDRKGKNTIVVNEDANIKINRQTIKDLLAKVDKGEIKIDCFYTTFEPLPEIVEYAIKEFSKRKIMIFCDAAPTARPLNVKLYPLIDFLSCNEVEVKAMTSVRVADQTGAETAAKKLRDRGAKTVIVTLGEKGAVLLSDKVKYFPGLKVKVVDETGAGDAFRAGFVTEYLETKNLDRAMEMGNKVGAFTVTRLGVYEALPTREALGFLKTL